MRTVVIGLIGAVALAGLVGVLGYVAWKLTLNPPTIQPPLPSLDEPAA